MAETHQKVSRQTFDNLLCVWKEGRDPNRNQLRNLANKAVRAGRLDNILEEENPLVVLAAVRSEARELALLKEFCSRFVDMSAVPEKGQAVVSLDFGGVLAALPTIARIGVFALGDRLIHVKTGRTYLVLERPSPGRLLEHTARPFYRYAEAEGTIRWSRDMLEMEDGRFVRQEPQNKEPNV